MNCVLRMQVQTTTLYNTAALHCIRDCGWQPCAKCKYHPTKLLFANGLLLLCTPFACTLASRQALAAAPPLLSPFLTMFQSIKLGQGP